LFGPNIPCCMRSSEKTRNSSGVIVIGNLIPHIVWDVAITIISDVLEAEEMISIWYRDEYSYKKKEFYRAPIRMNFTSTYQPSDNPLKIAVIATASSIGLLILVIAGLVCYVFQSRWYLILHLKLIRSKYISKTEKLGEGHFAEVWK